MKSTEKSLFNFDKKVGGEKILIGTDEAGRGPGAGPVYAAAVYFPKVDRKLIKLLNGLNDSKQVKESKRAELAEIIKENAIFEIVSATVEEIEKYNILKASLKCMKKCCESVIEKAGTTDVFVIADGNKLIPEFQYSQKCAVKGDGKSASIAAASILAKTARDNYMCELDKLYPEYGWSKNKGYLTEEHLKAVDIYGLTPHHRKKFFEKHFAGKQLSLF